MSVTIAASVRFGCDDGGPLNACDIDGGRILADDGG